MCIRDRYCVLFCKDSVPLKTSVDPTAQVSALRQGILELLKEKAIAAIAINIARFDCILSAGKKYFILLNVSFNLLLL